MTKFQKTENEKFFDKILLITREGGTYIWPDLGAAFKVTNGKLVAKDAQTLKDARSILSKEAGLRLFTL